MKRKKHQSPIALAGIYALITVLWVVFSDRLLAVIATDKAQLENLQTIKGVAFVLVMSGLLYWMLHAQQQRHAKYETERAQDNERFQTAFEYAQIIAGQLDTDLRYTWAFNPAVSQRSADSFIGKRIDEIVPGEAGQQILAMLREVIDTGEPCQIQVELSSPEGKPYFWGLTAKPLRNDTGIIDGVTSTAMDITQLVNAQNALAESEARYQRLTDNAQDIIFRYRFEPDRAFEYVNPAITAIAGYTPEELMADLGVMWQAIHPDDRHLLENIRTEHGVANVLELRWKHKNGSTISTEMHNVPVYDSEERVIAIEGIVRDVTQRKKAIDALRASEKRLSNLMGNLPGMVYRCRFDENWTMEFISEGGLALTGYPPETLLHNRDRSYASLIHPEDRTTVDVAIREAVRQDDSFMLTYRLQTATGAQKWVAEQGRAIYNEHGEITALEGFTSDITDRVQAQAIEAIAGTLTGTLDLDGVMTRLLEEVQRIIPHDAANILLIEGDEACPGYWRGYPEEFLPHISTMRVPLSASNLRLMLDTGEPQLIRDTAEFTDWVQTPQTVSYRSSAATPIYAHGSAIGFLSVDSHEPDFFSEADLSPLKTFANQAALAIENAQLYEQLSMHAHDLELRVKERTTELTQLTEKLEAILNNSSDVILLVRTDGTIERANSMVEDLLQCDRWRVLNQPLSTIANDTDRAKLQRVFEDVITQARPNRMEMVANCPNHQGFEADVTLSPITEHQNGQTQVSGVVVSIRDITDLKQTERQIRHMLEREMEVSELKTRYVSMASHELRNPLAAMQMSLELVQRYRDRLTAEHRALEFEKMRTSIRNMTDLLDNMLTIGRVESGRMSFQPEPVLIDELCRAIISDHRQGSVSATRISYIYEGQHTPVNADPRLMRHILGNLLSNALKYSPDNTRIKFKVQQNTDDVLITIEDQGIGIPDTEQHRLFEAFHRCNNVGSQPGNGLGLTIVKQAVEMHGGTITFESQQNEGTTFIVNLPVIAQTTAS